MGRAHSAVPLGHRTADPAVVPRVQACYESRGLTPVFRIPERPAFDAVRQRLRAAGYGATQPTLTMTGLLPGAAATPRDVGTVCLAGSPGDGWSNVFLGEGFDPVDGESRLGLLRRARQSVFASIEQGGEVVAVGSACFAHGWCGIHGMRTAPAWRGRGFASAILASLAREAAAQGLSRAFLQVEMKNAAARSLYRRAGLKDAWVYEYWRRPGPA